MCKNYFSHKGTTRSINGILNHGYTGLSCCYQSRNCGGNYLYYLLEDVLTLVVNAIVGVIVLFLVNLFHGMSLAGASDLPIDWITILVSAIGGLAGVVIVVILHLAGVVL